MSQRRSAWRALVLRIVHRFIEEDFDQVSASLAFTTLLSLVPLVAVVFGILSVLPSFLGLVDQFDRFVTHTLLPHRNAGIIIEHVLQFSKNALDVTLIGLSAVVATVYVLLLNIERAFNRAWGVSNSRVWWRRLRLYAAVLALWPLAVACVVFAISYAVTTSLGWVDEPSWLRNVLFKAMGLSVASMFFGGLYFAVPNARVDARDALWAGLFSALGFMLMQKAFGFYLSFFPTFTLVYGAFATVPIFLLWLYLSWALVLIGALLAVTLPEFRGLNRPPASPV